MSKIKGLKTYGKLAGFIYKNQDWFVHMVGLALDTIVGPANQLCNMFGTVAEEIAKQQGWSVGDASRGSSKRRGQSKTSTTASKYTVSEIAGTARQKLFPGITGCASNCNDPIKESKKADKSAFLSEILTF